MYCSKCGINLLDEDIFCSGCGNKLREPMITHCNDERSIELGKPILRGWGQFKPCKSLPDGFEWMQKRCTFIFYNRHFVAINADEKRSRFMDFIGNVGLPVGTAVIAAGLISLRAGLDTLKGNQFNLKNETIRFLKSEKQIVLASNDDVECWNYKRKPLLFYPVPEGWQLLCKFKISQVEYPCFLVMYCGPDVPGDWNSNYGISLQDTMTGFKPDKLFKCIMKREEVRDKELFSLMESDRMSFINSVM